MQTGNNAFTNTKPEKQKDLADESSDLPRGQTVIHARKDGYGNDDVAEDASHIVKRVYCNWESQDRHQN